MPNQMQRARPKGAGDSVETVAKSYENFAWISNWAEARVAVPAGVARVVIAPPPTWTLFTGYDTTDRVLQYHVMYRAQRSSAAPTLRMECDRT
ncbi:MAG: hypothetical protein ACYC3L_14615, partial [Gemmatimonadaceae bacterium]